MAPLDRRTFLSTAAAGSSVVAAGSLVSNTSAAEAAPEGDNERVGQTPHTKFAVNIEMWWRKLPLLDRIRKTAELGFPAVEFWPWQGKPLDEMAELCGSLDVDIAQFTAWGFRPGLNDPANHEKFIEQIKAGCDVAKKLNCKKMTVVGGDDQKGMTQKEMHDNIIAGLKLAAPIAEENEVMLILEPMNIRVDHKGHCLYGSEPTLKICREVDSPWVKINWDIYHLQITEGDLCNRIRDGFDQIGYIQIADSPGRREPGTGEINYTRVFQELARLGYDKPVGVECWPEGTEALAAERLRQADTWE